MALLRGNDLLEVEIDKSLIWRTEIPFADEERQSSFFSFMGLKWCLRFSYKGTIQSPPTAFSYVYTLSPDGDNFSPTTRATKNMYHVITLHRVINGQLVIATAASGRQLLNPNEKFSIKICLMSATSNGNDEFSERKTFFTKNVQQVWHGGENNDDIFKTLPFLYASCKVKVVCKFYGQPPSALQLDIRTDNPSPAGSGKLPVVSVDKGVQVSPEVPQDLETLSGDFADLLEKEILPDVKLECGGQTFQAHRSVLAARSKVLLAMFQNKMMESETGTVKIQDMDAPMLRKLLNFIYSGKTEELSEGNTTDLYEAADKYDVDSLKAACSYWIIRNMTVENCFKYLEMADCHCDCDLKDAVISFIISNSDVLKSAEWLALSKEHPALGVEVLQAHFDSTAQ